MTNFIAQTWLFYVSDSKNKRFFNFLSTLKQKEGENIFGCEIETALKVMTTQQLPQRKPVGNKKKFQRPTVSNLSRILTEPVCMHTVEIVFLCIKTGRSEPAPIL